MNNKEIQRWQDDNSMKYLQTFANIMNAQETWQYAVDQNDQTSRKGPTGMASQINYILIDKSVCNQVVKLERNFLNNQNIFILDHAKASDVQDL